MLRTTDAPMFHEPHKLSDYEYRPFAKLNFIEMLFTMAAQPADPAVEHAEALMAYETYNY